mgnify:FL=1
MIARQKQLLGSFERVLDFLSAFLLPTPPAKFAERSAELDATVARLRALTADQAAGQREAKDGTNRQVHVRKVLREKHLAPIARIAKAMLPDEPSIQKALAMPDGGLPVIKLIAVAGGIRTSAAKYEQVFVENGRPGDFLVQLDAAIEALRQTLLVRARSVGRHVGATAGLEQVLDVGKKCVQMLNAMVLDAFAGNAEVIATWRMAKRVQDVAGGGFRATGGTADENIAPVPEVPKAA